LGSQPRDEDLAHRLQRLVFRLGRELRAQSTGAGTSGADTMMLAELRRTPGLGVSDLAALDNVARSVTSERVKRLEAAGLIARDTVSGGDRRRVGLAITEAGHRVLNTITERRRLWMSDRLARLSLAEREAVDQAVAALEALTDRGAIGKLQDSQSPGPQSKEKTS
jgi:DNA-binding MarR family transcriptional regulator